MMTEAEYEQQLANYRARYLKANAYEKNWILEKVQQLRHDFQTDQEIRKRQQRALELGKGSA